MVGRGCCRRSGQLVLASSSTTDPEQVPVAVTVGAPSAGFAHSAVPTSKPDASAWVRVGVRQYLLLLDGKVRTYLESGSGHPADPAWDCVARVGPV